MKNQHKITGFKALHQQDTPLLLGNVWNAHTAKLAEQAGFQALGSSSHAMAFALGYTDGQNIPCDDIFHVIKRIVSVVSIPVSVDFEAGYSDDPKVVAGFVKLLEDVGIAGINLEDGKVIDGKRVLGDASLMQSKIEAIKSVTDIFINARTDTYTTKHSNALEESIKRANLYGKAGADGIFVPLIETEADIKSFVEKVNLPLNVFATANLPAYEKLSELGVKRISHGAKQYDLLMKKSEQIFKDFFDTKDYKILLG